MGYEDCIIPILNFYGAVAQLGERRVRNAKVEGSIPFRSTTLQRLTFTGRAFLFLGPACSFSVRA